MKKLITLSVVVAVLQSCAVSRAFVHWTPTVDDNRFFDTAGILPANEPFRFARGVDPGIGQMPVDPAVYGMSGEVTTLDASLASNDQTRAFILIRNDSVLYENYFQGHGPQDISGVFSVTKSIVALLTGIALDEGYINGIDDAVTDYLPDLARRNPDFGMLTVAHLLDMKGGFKFNEDSRSPFSRSAGLYYGNKLRRRVSKLKFEYTPGEWFEYQSAQTAVLGLVVERAVGKNLGEYLQEKVWTPLGMENRAEWAVDDMRNYAAKGHCGLYITAIDLSKIGRLYLNGGEWNGDRIVSQEWVDGTFKEGLLYNRCWWRPEFWLRNRDSADNFFGSEEQCREAVRAYGESSPGTTYSRVAESDRSPGRWIAYVYNDNFVARGIYQQILFVDPVNNIIGVRLGKHAGMDYSTLFRDISREL